MSVREKLSKEFSTYQDSFLSRWKKFVSFKSVSANPEFDPDCRNCAQWCSQWLTEIGFKSRLLETSSKPVVLAEFEGDKSKPRILFYGHYDVQPPEPLELWESPPFEAEIRNGRLYGRGAQDNKGQVSFVFAALERLIKNNALKCPLTVILEGEEETGSFGLAEKLEEWKQILKADVLMVCDTGALNPGVPCITMGLRGIFHLEYSLQGARGDLHSGIFGGVVRNPAVELARIIASLHKSDGSIAVPDFYKDIPPPTKDEKELLAKVQVDLAGFAQRLGCGLDGGEQQYSFHERRGLRPTIEVNGLWSGYTGPGSKTVIPSVANVKITGRTVRGQDPQRSMDSVADYIKSKVPAGTRLTLVSSFVGGPSVSLDASSALLKKVAPILGQISGERVEVTWEGGSIPIVAGLSKVSGAEPLLVGFALDEDNLHAPNESFSLKQFELGFRYSYELLRQMSE